MVGGAGSPGRSVPELRAAYDTAARLWAEAPEPAYASLARALLAQVGTGLAGTGPLVVDMVVLTAR